MSKKYDKIVIWGHKIHSHTHSYIHYGFFKAFKYLNYECLWLDNDDDLNKFNLNKSLFITEGQVDQNIPLINDCLYILHNCDSKKYKNFNFINLQVYTLDCDKKYGAKKMPNDYGFYLNDCIFICWATDLLPQEINLNINNIERITYKKEINFVGSETPIWDKVKLYCSKNNLIYNSYGGYSGNNINTYINIKLIQNSIVAPSIQDKWQVENGYIPCRIFKNISYGKMGLTNNKTVNKIFNNELIYDTDINNLLDKGKNFNDKNLLIKLMKNVRDNHTYINRINSIIWFIENIYDK